MSLWSLACALVLAAVPVRAYESAAAGQGNPLTVVSGARTGTAIAVIRPDNTLWAWGEYAISLQDENGNIEENVPRKVMDQVASISSGDDFIAAVKTDGTLWMWGGNFAGQLGNGTTDSAEKPVKVMDGVAAVSCGRRHTAAIKTDGTLWLWGDNSSGQLGNGGIGNATTSGGDPAPLAPRRRPMI